MCRPMVQFYVDSMRVKGRKPMPSTRDQTVEILERVLDTWEHEYGVTVMDEKIDGLTGAKIQAWFNKASSSWKPATANHCISILNPFLRWAAKMDGEQGDYVQKDFRTSCTPSLFRTLSIFPKISARKTNISPWNRWRSCFMAVMGGIRSGTRRSLPCSCGLRSVFPNCVR